MISFGLFFLGVIQVVTGLSSLFSSKKDEILGVKTLKGDLSIHRYMLTSLWISVGIIYCLGSFNKTFALTASLLGVLNISFEIIGYWVGFRNNKKFWWYPFVGTAVMGFCGVLCLIYLLKNMNL